MCNKGICRCVYSAIFLIFVTLLYARETYAKCNSLSQIRAIVKTNGKYEHVEFNECLENLSYNEVNIISCLKSMGPETFKNMMNLKRITIEPGNLNDISPNFTLNTPALREISINMNALTEVRKNVFPIIPLEKIDLGSNKINMIHEGAFKDIIVSFLILDDNKLKTIEPKWFHNSKVTRLFVRHNQINHIQSNAFKGIKYLEEINLSYNFINYIEDNAFSHLKSLRNLNLTGNTLTHLNFLDNMKLTKLDVGFNRISYIFLRNSTSIEYFLVFPNPWQCNCLQEFWKMAVVRNIAVGNTPSTKSTWREVYPVCVAKNPKCSKHENYDDIRMQYFKNVNYAKLDN